MLSRQPCSAQRHKGFEGPLAHFDMATFGHLSSIQDIQEDRLFHVTTISLN